MWHKILIALNCSKVILHSPAVSWILTTRDAINSEYLLNVNNNQQKDINLNPIWYYFISHCLLKLFLCYISDILSSKTSHFISTMKRCQTWFTTRNSLLQTSRKSTCSGKPSRNTGHESNTSDPTSHLSYMDFCITLKSVGSSMVSTITRIHTGRSGVQILDGTGELSFVQNIQASSCTHPPSNSMNTRAISLAVKWPGQTVWPHTSV